MPYRCIFPFLKKTNKQIKHESGILKNPWNFLLLKVLLSPKIKADRVKNTILVFSSWVLAYYAAADSGKEASGREGPLPVCIVWLC